MLRLAKTKFLFVLVIFLTSCTGGGSGSAGTGSTTGGTGGLGTTGGTTNGGTTTTGGTTTGGMTTGGTTTGGTTGGGNFNITESTVSVNASSGRVVVPYSVNLNSSTLTNPKLLQLTISLRSTTAFEIITKYPGGVLLTASLQSPSGSAVVPGPNNLFTTSALDSAASINTLNYQTRDADPAVVEGSYLQSIIFNASGPTQVTGTIIAKNDSNLTGGNLDLNVHLVGDEVQKTTNRLIIQSAIDVLKNIYATIGISVSVIYHDVSSSFGVLPSPIIGSSFYSAQGAASGLSQIAVNVYIGETISSNGTQSPGNTYLGVLGLTSFIPGPALVSNFSVVAVSLTEHQGPDGAFSLAEQSIFAETIAHESGHYLGLFHPVEASFNDFDPLSDTPECRSSSECRTKGIDSNLMYPTAISSLVQRNLTSNQRGVVNRNVIID